VEPAVDKAEQPDPTLSVVSAGVFDRDRGLEIHIGEALETYASLFEVPGTLRFVELKQHDYIVYTFK
jgi:hypothetical protein